MSAVDTNHACGHLDPAHARPHRARHRWASDARASITSKSTAKVLGRPRALPRERARCRIVCSRPYARSFTPHIVRCLASARAFALRVLPPVRPLVLTPHCSPTPKVTRSRPASTRLHPVHPRPMSAEAAKSTLARLVYRDAQRHTSQLLTYMDAQRGCLATEREPPLNLDRALSNVYGRLLKTVKRRRLIVRA